MVQWRASVIAHDSSARIMAAEATAPCESVVLRSSVLRYDYTPRDFRNEASRRALKILAVRGHASRLVCLTKHQLFYLRERL